MYKPLKKRSMSKYSGPLSKMIDKEVEKRMSALPKEDLGMVVEGSRAAKKAEKMLEKEAKKAAKEEKKLLKEFDGDQEALDIYLEKKAERQEKGQQYLMDYADDQYDEEGNLISKGLAGQGKGYLQEDVSGDRHYVMAERGGQEAVTGATSRETAIEREMFDKMTPQERDEYLAQKELEAKEYFAKERVETGKEPMQFKAQSHMLKGRSMSFRNKK
tara:strand:- start:86 stop:733 length:648 start_codon:yes stop_codon:yes gene_type:complete